METHKIETFEHDIANEIRQKEASISDIASAVGDIGNNESKTTSKNNSLVLMSIAVILTLSGLVGAAYFGYSTYMDNKKVNTEQQKKDEVFLEKKNPSGLQLSAISKTLNETLGTFLTVQGKTKDGYILTINSYSPVFAYMIRNELAFGGEIALAVGNTNTIKNGTSTAVVTPTTSTSSVSSSTKIQSTSTPITGVQEIPSTDYVFSDVTISNQNMRVGKSVYGTVVYAFIGTQALVISSSVEGVLSLRSNVIKK